MIRWSLDKQPPASAEFGFVATADVPTEDIPALVGRHLAPLVDAGQSTEETCPLFGGLVVEIDGRRVLYPQCCGDLSSYETWAAVLDPHFRHGRVALDGHPAPHVVRHDDVLEVQCVGDDIDPVFWPPCDQQVIIASSQFRAALENARQELVAFADRISRCEPERPGLGRLLVFGEPT
ncbi:MAG: hypothetical protein ABMA64_34710 [Myxococcota bacterium]